MSSTCTSLSSLSSRWSLFVQRLSKFLGSLVFRLLDKQCKGIVDSADVAVWMKEISACAAKAMHLFLDSADTICRTEAVKDVSEAVFDGLDTDKDGKISKEEAETGLAEPLGLAEQLYEQMQAGITEDMEPRQAVAMKYLRIATDEMVPTIKGACKAGLSKEAYVGTVTRILKEQLVGRGLATQALLTDNPAAAEMPEEMKEFAEGCMKECSHLFFEESERIIEAWFNLFSCDGVQMSEAEVDASLTIFLPDKGHDKFGKLWAMLDRDKDGLVTKAEITEFIDKLFTFGFVFAHSAVDRFAKIAEFVVMHGVEKIIRQGSDSGDGGVDEAKCIELMLKFNDEPLSLFGYMSGK